MKFILPLIILHAVILANTASASANYYPAYDEIGIYYEDVNHNMSWLYSHVGNDQVLSHIDTTYYLNTTLHQYSSSGAIDICPPSCTKLIMNNSGKFISGNYNIHDVEIVGGGEIATYNNFSNVYWHDSVAWAGLLLYGISKDVSNLTLINVGTGPQFYGSHGIKVYNVTVNHTIGSPHSGLLFDRCHDIEAYDITLKDIGNHMSHTTDNMGIRCIGSSGSYCYNISAHDIDINGTGWSSLQYSDLTYNISYYNATVRNTGHNGIDMHGGDRNYANNITIYGNGDSTVNLIPNNVLVAYATNCTLKNIYSYNSTPGKGFWICDNQDTYAENITVNNSSTAIQIFNTNNTTLVNVSGSKSVYGLNLCNAEGGNAKNTTIIDGKFFNNINKDLWIESADNSKFINVNYLTCLYGNSDAELTFYYYPDICVKNNSGFMIANATVAFTSPLYPNILSINGYGKIETMFLTDLNGHTYIPKVNREKSPALSKEYRNSTVAYNTLYNSVISKSLDSRITTLSGITPDSSWFRQDPNISTYTITAVIPDSDLIGPHIIGFAPSIENPFIPGEKKHFRVWTDGNLSEMRWTAFDETNDTRQTLTEGALICTWVVNKSISKIEFSGMGANGEVKQVWNLGNKNEDLKFLDLNKNGFIDLNDLSQVTLHFGTTLKEPYPDWDIDQNGVIDIRDLILIGSHFGQKAG